MKPFIDKRPERKGEGLSLSFDPLSLSAEQSMTETVLRTIKRQREDKLMTDLSWALSQSGFQCDKKTVKKRLYKMIEAEEAMQSLIQLSHEPMGAYQFTEKVMEVISKWKQDKREPVRGLDDDFDFIPGLVTEE